MSTVPLDIDAHFREAVAALPWEPTAEPADPDRPVRPGSSLTGAQAAALYQAQVTSRHLDLAARWLRAYGEGFHTVESAGHEGIAAVAAALRPTDPALLHYRDGGFYCARAAQVDGVDVVRDVLRGVVAASTDPVTGGRHKIFGSPALAVISTTAHAACHLPRAVGLAFALTVSPRLNTSLPWPQDSIVVASFGEASVNRAVTTVSLTMAGWCAHSGLPLPVLFICEDNSGASQRSDSWVARSLRDRPGLRYFTADGCDVAATYEAARQAASWVRQRRRPAILHLSLVRLLGDMGSGDETRHRPLARTEVDLTRDPLVITARMLVEAGLADPEELITRYDTIGWHIRAVAEEVVAEPKPSSAREVMASIAPRRPLRVAQAAARAAPAAERTRVFADRLPEQEGPLTLARAINRALVDALSANPRMLVFGQDVGAGGADGVTAGLQDLFGAARVFDTPPDEITILGLALGAGVAGLLPVPEIRSLSALHHLEDQLRREAAPLQYLSQGAYRNPLVIRVTGHGYRDDHDDGLPADNTIAALRDIPGLVIAAPARPDDAAAMLRTCLAAARTDGICCVFVEPAALYHTRDLYAPDDDGWLAEYPEPERWAATHVPIGRARVYGEGEDVTIVTYGNGLRMSLRVARRLANDSPGITCRVVDLRWLAPLPVDDLLREANVTGRVLVVDETRRRGGIGEGVVAALLDAGYRGRVTRVASVDSFIPQGPAARHVLLGEQQIQRAVDDLVAD